MNEQEEFEFRLRFEREGARAPAQVSPKKPEWSDLPGNILPSAGRFFGGVADAAMHPIRTAGGIMDMAAGGLRNLTPEPLRKIIDSVDTVPGSALTDPEAGPRASAAADAVGKFYKDRYGSPEGLKRTAIEDPVGIAADASAVLGLGAGTARLAGAPGVSKALTTASNATNPLSVVGPAVQLAGKAAKPILGMTTGVGPENIGQAFKAGVQKNPDFMAGLKGEAPIPEVVDRAKQGIANMAAQKSADYRANMAAVSGDKTVLSFKGIDQAISDAASKISYKGVPKNERAAQVVQKMADEVENWRQMDPAQFHTPEGLDALKQRLGGLIESIPFEEKAARLAGGGVYNAVKAEITKQAPTYAKTMKQYADASEEISQIERALSLGGKSAQDTAIRKLQSLTRNNAQTNYGNRLDMAKVLAEQGGADILPSLAGQAMSSWTPRSLSGQMGGMGTMLAAAAHNPALGLLLPLQSPKFVGAASYGLGRASGGARGLLGQSGLDALRAGGLLGYESGLIEPR